MAIGIYDKSNLQRMHISEHKAMASGGYWVIDEASPVIGLAQKYIKLGANAWTPVEMTAEEKTAVDAGITLEQQAQLAEAKKIKTAEMQEAAIAWAMAQFPGRRIEGYILNLYPDTLKIQIQQTAVVAFTRLKDIIYPLIDIAESVSEVSAIQY